MALEEKMNFLTIESKKDYKDKIMALKLLKCTNEKEMLAYMEEENVRIQKGICNTLLSETKKYDTGRTGGGNMRYLYISKI